MKVVSTVLVTLAVAQVVVASFVGQWTDTPGQDGYGVSLFVCVDGDAFYGFYSEYGIMRGTVVGNAAVGRWYEGGGVTARAGENGVSHPTWGTFSLVLSGDDQSFSGTWDYGDGSTGGIWDETRVSIDEPTDSQCWRRHATVTSDSILGRWEDPNSSYEIAVCRTAEEDRFYDTYTHDFGQEGFTSGIIVDGVYMGQWFEYQNVHYGVVIYDTYARVEGFRAVWWDIAAIDDVPSNIDNGLLHGMEDYDEYNGLANDRQCTAYYVSSAASKVAAPIIVALGLSMAFF
mmetsp:Transcript_26922/g.75260  ORF Transcript_26922/g.75260 Transcript_26922/m.75260 type:complete len:287 (+) Transcript_26922:75-935(+)